MGAVGGGYLWLQPSPVLTYTLCAVVEKPPKLLRAHNATVGDPAPNVNFVAVVVVVAWPLHPRTCCPLYPL